MTVGVYTLTRDRLEYTQRSFAALEVQAGVPYQHYVIDNGSEDGTAEWLADWAAWQPNRHVEFLPENVGISAASNLALESMLNNTHISLICKMDNDCQIATPKLLRVLRDISEYDTVLSPRVVGINNQPHRAREVDLNGWRVGVTGMVGGLFHAVPRDLYARFRYPTDLPLAWGQDDAFCQWAVAQGATVGYVEDLVVEHIDSTDGQAIRYPAYFERKWREEKQTP